MNKKPVLPPYTRRPIAAGLVAMYKQGRWAFAVERQHRRSEEKIRRILAKQDEVSVELGGAKRPGGDGWIRLDLVWQCDVYWNLARGLPLPADRVKQIYSSHFFEHLTFKQGQAMLKECLRVLVPGGHFSVCVPNARPYLEAYCSGKEKDKQTFIAFEPAWNNTTMIDYVNYTAYMDNDHRYMFDEENLVKVLEVAGFRNARLRKFDPTLDMESRDYESIYAEAEK